VTAEVLCQGNKMVGTLAGNSIKWGEQNQKNKYPRVVMVAVI